MATNYKQRYAIDKKNRERLLKVNPKLSDVSGIYFLTREDEDGFKYAYIGQAKKVLSRMVSHLSGFQHIDLSLKKHGFYSIENPTGWKLNYLPCLIEQLDAEEQRWIKEYANKGYQLRNKTSGSQGSGKKQIDEYRPAKTYRDGIAQGVKNSSREIAHLFDLHLDVKTKNNPPTANQRKALEKFNDFLTIYKGDNDKND